MRLETIRLHHVETMPKELAPGILYVALEYGAAAHLCACGCGKKIRTPLHETEWKLTETPQGPSLWPSVGNWQKDCKSHYVIDRRRIVWAGKWSPEQILAGRRAEEQRRNAYFEALYAKKPGLVDRVWMWIKSLLGL